VLPERTFKPSQVCFCGRATFLGLLRFSRNQNAQVTKLNGGKRRIQKQCSPHRSNRSQQAKICLSLEEEAVVMKAVSKILTGAAAVAAISLGAAAPAAAQYYPNPYGGYGNGGLGDVITGAILGNILRGGNPYGGNAYYGTSNYDMERAAVQQCAGAAEQRINSRYGGGYYNQGAYGGYNQPYGYNQAGAYRVVQIDRVNRTRNGNMRVYGLATNAAYQGNYGQPYYGGYNQPYGGYNQPDGGYNQRQANFRFDCKFDRSGRISDLKVHRA
jgi:hypothetical protein